MRRAGRELGRCDTRIAQQKLLGHDLSRIVPAEFNATLTNAFVLEALAWTAALRERRLSVAGRPVPPGLPRLVSCSRNC
jgi:hypothetical protein